MPNANTDLRVVSPPVETQFDHDLAKLNELRRSAPVPTSVAVRHQGNRLSVIANTISIFAFLLAISCATVVVFYYCGGEPSSAQKAAHMMCNRKQAAVRIELDMHQRQAKDIERMIVAHHGRHVTTLREEFDQEVQYIEQLRSTDFRDC